METVDSLVAKCYTTFTISLTTLSVFHFAYSESFEAEPRPAAGHLLEMSCLLENHHNNQGEAGSTLES